MGINYLLTFKRVMRNYSDLLNVSRGASRLTVKSSANLSGKKHCLFMIYTSIASEVIMDIQKSLIVNPSYTFRQSIRQGGMNPMEPSLESREGRARCPISAFPVIKKNKNKYK